MAHTCLFSIVLFSKDGDSSTLRLSFEPEQHAFPKKINYYRSRVGL